MSDKTKKVFAWVAVVFMIIGFIAPLLAIFA